MHKSWEDANVRKQKGRVYDSLGCCCCCRLFLRPGWAAPSTMRRTSINTPSDDTTMSKDSTIALAKDEKRKKIGWLCIYFAPYRPCSNRRDWPAKSKSRRCMNRFDTDSQDRVDAWVSVDGNPDLSSHPTLDDTVSMDRWRFSCLCWKAMVQQQQLTPPAVSTALLVLLRLHYPTPWVQRPPPQPSVAAADVVGNHAL